MRGKDLFMQGKLYNNAGSCRDLVERESYLKSLLAVTQQCCHGIDTDIMLPKIKPKSKRNEENSIEESRNNNKLERGDKRR